MTYVDHASIDGVPIEVSAEKTHVAFARARSVRLADSFVAAYCEAVELSATANADVIDTDRTLRIERRRAEHRVRESLASTKAPRPSPLTVDFLIEADEQFVAAQARHREAVIARRKAEGQADAALLRAQMAVRLVGGEG